jgi:hypothetical protein
MDEMKIQEVLNEDAGMTLGFWQTERQVGHDLFNLVLSDSNGYMSMLITKEDWQRIKSEVDGYLK